MIVATFNATTGWAGRNITWQDDRLVLDGHGVISAFDVMGYDGQGQLDWPSEEMRAWAAARYSWELAVAAPAAVSMPEATPAAATATSGAAAMPEASAAAATQASVESDTSLTPTAPVTPTTPVTPTAPVTPTTAAHIPYSAETAAESPAPAAESAATEEEPPAEEPVADADAPAADDAETEAAATEPVAELEAEPEPEAAPAPSEEVYDVLAPGGDIVEVVGTAPYQEALEAIVGDKPETAPELEKWAHLIPEPENPWDRNAVAVYIAARKIGYLPRESSAAYAALLTQLWTTSRARAVCRAVITGGSYTVTTPAGTVAEVDDERFGVKLGLAAPQHFDVTRGLRTLTTEELKEGPPPI